MRIHSIPPASFDVHLNWNPEPGRMVWHCHGNILWQLDDANGNITVQGKRLPYHIAGKSQRLHYHRANFTAVLSGRDTDKKMRLLLNGNIREVTYL